MASGAREAMAAFVAATTRSLSSGWEQSVSSSAGTGSGL